MANRKCWVDGCRELIDTWGMCTEHCADWHRLVRIPRTRLMGASDEAKFEHYAIHGTSLEVQRIFGARADCWPWGGGLNPYGYGQFRSAWSKQDGGSAFAHLYALVKVARIERDFEHETDHLCRFRPCVNPDHLEQVTQWENNRRGISPPSENFRKTHCDEGHEFTLENTWVDENGWRRCRECNREANREWTSRPEIKAARLEKYVPSTGIRGKGQYQSAQDRCGKGHLLEGDNLTQEKRTRNGKVSYVRRCRTCVNSKARGNYAKRSGKM